MPRVVKKPQNEVRHDPLYKELAEDDLVQKFGRVSKPGKRVKSKSGKNEEGGKEEVCSSSIDSYEDWRRGGGVEARAANLRPASLGSTRRQNVEEDPRARPRAAGRDGSAPRPGRCYPSGGRRGGGVSLALSAAGRTKRNV